MPPWGADWRTARRWRDGAGSTSGRAGPQQPVEILGTRSAGAQMRGDPGVLVAPGPRPRRRARRRRGAAAAPRRSRGRRGSVARKRRAVVTTASRAERRDGRLPSAPCQLAAGVEERLVDRVAVRAELDGERVGRDAVQHDRDDAVRCRSLSSLLDGRAQRRDELASLRPFGDIEPEAVRQRLPVLGVVRELGPAPEVPADLGGDFEDGELARPGREAALASELAEPAVIDTSASSAA